MVVSRLLKSIFLPGSVTLSLSAMAQAFPNKTVNFVVPFPAGGALDFVARYMSKEMMPPLKQTVLVDNVVGVGGSLGALKALNAPADGYTVLITDMNVSILTPLAYNSAKYKSEDLKTVAMVGEADIMLVVRKDLGVNSVEELVELAKKSADKPLSYCTAGIGSQFHLISEKFNAVAGTKSLHVPYNGFPQCLTNLVGSLIDYAFLPMAGPFPGMVEKGAMKLLAVTSTKPNPKFPSAPLLKNSKGYQDLVFTAWGGLHVNSKVPDDIVLALNKAALVALETTYVKETIASSGSIRFDLWNPKQAHDYYLREVAKYQAIAKSINLQAN